MEDACQQPSQSFVYERACGDKTGERLRQHFRGAKPKMWGGGREIINPARQMTCCYKSTGSNSIIMSQIIIAPDLTPRSTEGRPQCVSQSTRSVAAELVISISTSSTQDNGGHPDVPHEGG